MTAAQDELLANHERKRAKYTDGNMHAVHIRGADWEEYVENHGNELQDKLLFIEDCSRYIGSLKQAIIWLRELFKQSLDMKITYFFKVYKKP